MKKSLLALAALTAFAGVASAQSSVTLFGGVDLNLRNQKNGSAGSVKSMSQDGIYSSRIGLRGVEDLGGGLKGNFWIEGGWNPDTGCGQGPAVAAGPGTASCGGMTWQRLAYVGLSGGFGEIRLGRDYTPSFSNHAAFDPFGNNGVASSLSAHSVLNSGATTQVRASNSIGYFLPAMGGLYGTVMVAAGEGVTGNKYVGGRIGYAAGPINVSVALGKTSKTGAMTDDFTDFNAGLSWNMGFMTLMGYYGKADYAQEDQKQLGLGVTVPVGAGLLRASFNKNSGKSATAQTDQYDNKQIGLGYIHNLSKRTAVYATYSSLNNGGSTVTGSNRVVSGQTGSGAAGMLRGETSSGYEFGLRHIF